MTDKEYKIIKKILHKHFYPMQANHILKEIKEEIENEN